MGSASCVSVCVRASSSKVHTKAERDEGATWSRWEIFRWPCGRISVKTSGGMGSTLSCSRSSDVVVTSTFESMYEIGAELGKGHFAVVHACVHVGTGVKYAVKVINKRRVTNPMSMREEVTVLRKVGRHPYCIELVDVFEDDSNFYLVMELCTGGDLFSRIVDYGSYSEMDASRTLFQLATALDHIHQQGITHRDLKPENILLLNSTPDSDLKVGDFGLSKIVEGGPSVVMKTICGTWAYCGSYQERPPRPWPLINARLSQRPRSSSRSRTPAWSTTGRSASSCSFCKSVRCQRGHCGT